MFKDTDYLKNRLNVKRNIIYCQEFIFREFSERTTSDLKEMVGSGIDFLNERTSFWEETKPKK